MSSWNRFVRSGIALGAGALALGAGAAPALAVDGTAITGSGSSLQRSAQTQWISAFNSSTRLVGGSVSSYTSTSSGAGLNVFGADDGTLNLPGSGDIQAYAGTDEAPTATELRNAKTAGGPDLITVPVTQAPVAVLLGLPRGVSVSGTVNLTTTQVVQAYSGTVPASAGYAANTYGALLQNAGASFTERTAGDAAVAIKLLVRTAGSGTTKAIKDYLSQASTLISGPSFTVDTSTTWPAAANARDSTTCGATTTQQSGSGAEVRAIQFTPASLGYVNLADAKAAGFSTTQVASTVADPCGTTPGHNVLFAQLQNNGTTSPATFASPENGGKANVRTGSAGSWRGFPASVTTTTSWDGTTASNPAVGAESGINRYPLVAATYIAAYDNYTTGNIARAVADGTKTGATVKDYAFYLTNQNGTNTTWLTTGGQTLLNTTATDARYYGALPSTVLALARTAAGLVG